MKNAMEFAADSGAVKGGLAPPRACRNFRHMRPQYGLKQERIVGDAAYGVYPHEG
jgi:hypothetical protein